MAAYKAPIADRFQPVDVERHIFDKLDITVRRIISNAEETNPIIAELHRNPQIRDSMRVSAYYDNFIKGMVVDLLAWLVKSNGQHNTVNKDMTIKVPTNWWETLKRDHFPRWFIGHYPVKTKDIIETFAFEQEIRVCSHCDVPWQDACHIEFLEFKDNRYPVYQEGKTPEGRDIVFTKPAITDKPPDHYGVPCPNCGLGIDTDGDGNCVLCGPKYQQLKKA